MKMIIIFNNKIMISIYNINKYYWRSYQWLFYDCLAATRIFSASESNQIWFVNTLFRFIQYHTEFSLVLNLSEKGNYNPNLVWFNQNQKNQLCKQYTERDDQKFIWYQSTIMEINWYFLYIFGNMSMGRPASEHYF